MQTNSQNDRDFDHDHAYMENTQHEALQPLVQDNSQEGAPDADTHSVHVLRCPGIDSNDQLWDSNTTPNSSTSEAPSYSKIYSDEHVVREIIHVEDDHQKPQIGTPNSLRVPITWRQRITVYVIFVMVASTLMLVATAAFISFLWFGNQSSRLWRKIALSEWMPRAITLSALIVRLAVSLQAGLTTSMLASLVIEGDSVRLIDALEISMARFSNAGPHTLLWPCVRQSKSIALVILHIALVLTTLAAQFASTFLLSDVAIAGQITLAENNTFSYGFSTDYPVELTLESSTAPDYWIQPPRNFPTFGEYFLEPDIDDKIDDTGLVLRSFLPIPAQSTRESLHRYDGSAFTYDARIACTRPVFKNLTTCISSDRDQGYLCGEILPENVPENATINLDAIPFKCYVPLSTCAFKEPCSDPAWTVCPLDISAGGLIPILDPTNNASLIHVWDNGTDIPSSTGRGKWKAQTGNREWPVGVGNAYLLVNATNASIVHADWHGDVSYTGAWTDVYSEDDSVVSSKEPLRATLCYDALPYDNPHSKVHDWNVSLTRNVAHQEPSIDLGSLMEGFNTTGVRGQIIGQHGLTAAEQRGIMTLEGTEILDLVAQMRAVWQPGVENKQGNYTTKPEWPSAPSSPWIFRSIFPLQQSRSSCPLCFTSLDNKPTNILQGSIFSDVLTETGSPARALQAHLTIVVGMAYYTFLPLFDTSSNASMTVFVSRLMPVSASGYWSVMGILGMHVLICSVLGTLYVLMAEHSLLGNAWAAVAQVANTELAQIIMREGTLSTDSEIAKELRRTGELGTRYQLVRTWDGDGAVLVPISDDLKLPSRLAPYLRAKGQRKKLQRHSKQVSEYELSKGYFGHEEVKEVCSSRSSGISSGIDGEH